MCTCEDCLPALYESWDSVENPHFAIKQTADPLVLKWELLPFSFVVSGFSRDN